MSIFDSISKLVNKDAEANSKDALISLIDKLNSEAVIDQHITHMLKGVLAISNLKARDLMIPRAHIDYFNYYDDINYIIDKVIENGHSRYPILSDDQESLGLLFSKDLLNFLKHESLDQIELKDIIKPVKIVPETKRVTTLLQEFQAHQRHLALVVNEFGEISGLITIEDILEEIVGEISDEYDKLEMQIRKVSKTTYDVFATTPIEEFNKVFHLDLSDEEFDTIGGYLVNAIGRVPQRNEVIDLPNSGLIIRVAQANFRQLIKIRIRIQDDKVGSVNLNAQPLMIETGIIDPNIVTEESFVEIATQVHNDDQ